MFKKKKKKVVVSVTIPSKVLSEIYDECDHYDIDETGGRLIGTYKQTGAQYDITVSGVLGPGPNATRSRTSFFQDGTYQEQMFRAIEAKHPEIEHLGNWHTHHVNGYPTLSGGDITTYLRTVNHQNHNTDFFYALLVIKKNTKGNPRYNIKHFFFRRDDATAYEIPDSQVQIVDVPETLMMETDLPEPTDDSTLVSENRPMVERAKDQEFFGQFYPGLKAMVAKTAGTLYWKGFIELADGSRPTIAAIENTDPDDPCYAITAADENPTIASVKASYKLLQFKSARHAVIQLERDLNRAIYESCKGK